MSNDIRKIIESRLIIEKLDPILSKAIKYSKEFAEYIRKSDIDIEKTDWSKFSKNLEAFNNRSPELKDSDKMVIIVGTLMIRSKEGGDLTIERPIILYAYHKSFGRQKNFSCQYIPKTAGSNIWYDETYKTPSGYVNTKELGLDGKNSASLSWTILLKLASHIYIGNPNDLALRKEIQNKRAEIKKGAIVLQRDFSVWKSSNVDKSGYTSTVKDRLNKLLDPKIRDQVKEMGDILLSVITFLSGVDLSKMDNLKVLGKLSDLQEEISRSFIEYSTVIKEMDIYIKNNEDPNKVWNKPSYTKLRDIINGYKNDLDLIRKEFNL